MAKSQENGTTILLGLKDYRVGEVWGGEERVVVKTAITGKEKGCPCYGLARLYRHGACKPREVLHSWSHGKRVYLELHHHRWRSRDCSHTFAEGTDLVQSRSRLTRQAEAEEEERILAQAKVSPELSARQLALRIVDSEGLYVSESTVFRILRREGLIKPAEMVGFKAGKEYQRKTKKPNKLWATDCAHLNVVDWGWYYMATVMDDYSRFILAWELKIDIVAGSLIDVVHRRSHLRQDKLLIRLLARLVLLPPVMLFSSHHTTPGTGDLPHDRLK